ncbi:flagellar biosynthetic protein FliQ, partial [Escherichia coli]
MTVEMVLDVLREAFLRILAISGPALLVGMLVGLVISIFQATTQIQEQTLSFVPKLLAIFLTLILAGNFMLNLLL